MGGWVVGSKWWWMSGWIAGWMGDDGWVRGWAKIFAICIYVKSLYKAIRKSLMPQRRKFCSVFYELLSSLCPKLRLICCL
jgi:hypothetical protein